jgi:dihydrophenazinedicarboxylate synthase
MNATRLDLRTPSAGPPSPPDEALPADPVALFHDRLDSAISQGVEHPTVLALATSDAHGHASSRMVRAISVTAQEIVFTSHTGSQKGRDLAVTGWACAVLYWREIKEQVILSGPVDRLDPADSDALWASRPIAVQAMSAVSRQSATLDDEETLHAASRRLRQPGLPLRRPESWAGYRLVPATVEFWQASPDGLHRRWYYERAGDGWTARRLQP